MGAKIAGIAVLVLAGAMLADLVANPAGTKTLIDGIGGLWKTSVNGVLGKSS